MSCNIRVGDIGVVLRITLLDCNDDVIDISGADILQLIFKKPDGTSITKTASLYTDGTDGIVSYTLQDGDIDQAGLWKMQARVVVSGFNEYKSTITTLKIYTNI